MLTNLCSQDFISRFGLSIHNSYNPFDVLRAVEQTRGTHSVEEAEEEKRFREGGEMEVPEFR